MRQASSSSSLLPGALALVVGAAVGCGIGDAPEGLFAEGGAGGASSTTTSSAGTTGGGGDMTTTTTTTATTTTTTTTTGAGGAPPTLDCGDEICPQGGNNACCWEGYFESPDPGTCVEGPPSSEVCNTEVTQNGLKTRIECQLPSHCDAGQICCADRQFVQQKTHYISMTCQTTCTWPDVHACDLAAPDVCPVVSSQGQMVQTVCKASQVLPPGYTICAP